MIHFAAIIAIVLAAIIIMAGCIAYGMSRGRNALILEKINAKEIILLQYSNLKGLRKKQLLDAQDLHLLRKITEFIPKDFFVSVHLYGFAFAETNDNGYVPANIDFAVFNEQGSLVGAILVDSKLRSGEEKRYFKQQRAIIESLDIWVLEYAVIPDDASLKSDLNRSISSPI